MKKFDRYFGNNKGVLLVEILLAITIVSVALLAIGSLVTTSSKSLSANDLQTTAQKTAQARMEALKSVSEKAWKDLGLTDNYTDISVADIHAVIDTFNPPSIDSRCTLLMQGKNTVIGAVVRLVQVRVVASCKPIGANSSQTRQFEFVTLFGREP